MINTNLATSFNIANDVVPTTRQAHFKTLASQTSQQERESLYAVARYVYSGEGDVWDIGCAAGGSSFCLAAGIQDKSTMDPQLKVKCFDLFSGYSGNSFNEKFTANMTDLDIFNSQTKSLANFVTPVKMNLITDLDSFEIERPIEIVHIDAAKSLILWASIFKKISSAVIPNKTIWIFQDFERARLPWQIYSLALLMNNGEIIGGAKHGTIYFKFNSKISNETRNKIIEDNFSIQEKINNIKSVFDIIRANHLDIFSDRFSNINDLEYAVSAYCYYWQGDKEHANAALKKSSASFLSHPYHKIYSQEIFEQ